MNQTTKAIWEKLKSAKTRAEVFKITIEHFDSQDDAAKFAGVVKSRISEMKTSDRPANDRQRTAALGSIIRKREQCE